MGFTDFFIRWFGGIPGKTLFNILIRNQVIITSLVVIYGGILMIASYNYKKTIPKITINFIRERALEIAEKGNQEPIERICSIILDEWINMVNNLPRHLFIPSRNDFWIIFPNGKKYAERFDINEKYIADIIKRIGLSF